MKRIYTLWVGGVEVNDYLLTWDEANDLATDLRQAGYDDVEIGSYEATV